MQGHSNQVAGLFDGKHASGITPEARSLIEKLLERDMACRPGMSQVALHDFFTTNALDVFSLHKQPPHPLDVGDVSPSTDADKWSR